MMGNTSGNYNEGYAHPDTKHKIITVLLGFSGEWPYESGRLRVLRSNDREDYAFEFAPEFGKMLMFRVCDHSWHGFLPQKGQRMSMQLCYVDSEWYVASREYIRHGISAFAKSIPRPSPIGDLHGPAFVWRKGLTMTYPFFKKKKKKNFNLPVSRILLEDISKVRRAARGRFAPRAIRKRTMTDGPTGATSSHVILHQDRSTRGRVGTMLAALGARLDVRRPSLGDPLPETLADHDAALVFGGPMSANDEARLDEAGDRLAGGSARRGASRCSASAWRADAGAPGSARACSLIPTAAARSGLLPDPADAGAGPFVRGALSPPRLPMALRRLRAAERGASCSPSGGADFPNQAFVYDERRSAQFHPR